MGTAEDHTARMEPNAVRCHLCPMCGGPPEPRLMQTWPQQAWCANQNCDTICWNAAKTLDENITNATVHKLPGLFNAP